MSAVSQHFSPEVSPGINATFKADRRTNTAEVSDETCFIDTRSGRLTDISKYVALAGGCRRQTLITVSLYLADADAIRSII